MTEQDRRRLQRAIGRARSLLEADFAETLEGRFGIHLSGKVEDASRLALSASDQATREDLLGVLQHLRAMGENAHYAAARLLRETVFTTLNRLVAIRIAEAIGLLPESLARGKASRGFREVLEVFPLLAGDAHGGYWTYLRLCADELAADAPVLFDPRNPLLAVEPTPAALDALLDILTDPDLKEVWAHPETFGWTYQYFVSDDERRVAREESAPRNSRELAVRNQWFTQRYVVDFLVHNTLGRRLVEGGYDLRDHLPMLVDTPQLGRKRLDLEQVRVLDPAVGSGHFLLGAYDVLERAWELAGVNPDRAVARILPCLWGIDIDPRCAQVAAAALVLRARRRARDGDVPRPNIVTARPLPADPKRWDAVLQDLDGGIREVVSAVRSALAQAAELGSLLKAEEALRSALHRVAAVPAGGIFTEEQAREHFREAERRALDALRRITAGVEAAAAERLFAADASDALRFVEAVHQRYDAVLMNPPFGYPIPETKDYLLDRYTRIHAKQYNIFGPFVERGVELLNEAGYLGAITSRAGFFLVSFERWRKEFLLRHRLVALADLGYGVMEGAMVEAAAYVVAAEPRRRGEPTTFLRLLKDTDRPAALAEACRDAREGRPSVRVFRVAPEELEEIPGAPLAYWVAPSIRRLFTELPPLEGNGAEVRQGLATADDFRFVRAFWEVDPARIGRSREETFQGKRWVPFAKGGEYSPYYADIHLVVDWEEDGRRIREYIAEQYPYLEGNVEWVVKNTQYYFRPGLTWPERTNSGFAPRTLPAGGVFSHVGYGCFPLGSPALMAVWLNDRVVRLTMDGLTTAGEETSSGSPARHYLVGLVQKLPWPGPQLEGKPATSLAQCAAELIAIRASFDEGEETTRRFVCPTVLRHDGETLDARARAAVGAYEDSVLRGLAVAHESERIFHGALALDADAERYLDEEYGPHPESYSADPLSANEEKEFARLYAMSIDKVIDEVVEARGGARTIATKSYFLDRRLEVLAHVFRRHPRVLVETRRRLGLLPPEEPRRSAEDLVSYLVGCAFGRWDVRIGRDPSLAPPAPGPFDPVPICSPGMLVGPDGLPAREAPEGYPLELPPDRTLLDEEGHPWDIVRRVRAVAAVLFDDPDGILEECEKILGRDLRSYLRRDFFKTHLARYSKSRRKAPIYWYLSVPSREWGIWVYAPALTRETLFALVREARRKEEALRGALETLHRQSRDARGREAQRLGNLLEDQEALLKEVTEFRAEAERVANLGWEPDLDDGMVLVAAPLSKLFPAWRATGRADSKNPADPEQARRALKTGNFRWATVSKWAEAL
jgi:hypothetical protein